KESSAHSEEVRAHADDCELYTTAATEREPTHIADELNVPASIGLRRFKKRIADYYGEEKSLTIWAPKWLKKNDGPIPADVIIVADLSEWGFRPLPDHIVVDPALRS